MFCMSPWMFCDSMDVLYVPQMFKCKPEKLNSFIGTKQKSTSQSSKLTGGDWGGRLPIATKFDFEFIHFGGIT